MTFLQAGQLALDMWGSGKAWMRLAIICQTLWFVAVVFLATTSYKETPLAAMLVILVGSIVVFVFAAPDIAALGTSIGVVQTTMAKILGIEFAIWLVCRIVPIENQPELVWIILAICGAFAFFLFSTNKLPVQWELWVPRILWALALLLLAIVIVLFLGGWDNVTRNVGSAVKPVQQSAVSAPAANGSSQTSPAKFSSVSPMKNCAVEGTTSNAPYTSNPFTDGCKSISIVVPPNEWGRFFTVPAGTYLVHAEGQTVHIQFASGWGGEIPAVKTMRDGETVTFSKPMIVSFRSASPSPARVTLEKEK